LWVPPMPWPPWNRESTIWRPRVMSCWSSDASWSASIARQRPFWDLDACAATLRGACAGQRGGAGRAGAVGRRGRRAGEGARGGGSAHRRGAARTRALGAARPEAGPRRRAGAQLAP
jgi:hypothetical protein